MENAVTGGRIAGLGLVALLVGWLGSSYGYLRVLIGSIVFLADQGTRADTLATLAAARAWAEERNVGNLAAGRAFLVGGAEFGLDLFGRYLPSPQLVWFLEIVLIVGGHIIGVLAAHRIALRLAPSHGAAVKSHTVLTLLMSAFTIVTLYLLSLPLVVQQA